MAHVRRVVHGLERGARIEIEVDGEALEAYLGETVATALLAGGRRAFRRMERSGAPRGLFCGIGVCFDCLVWTSEGVRVRACQTPVAPGLRFTTQAGPPSEEGRGRPR